MAVENATYISDLVESNPVATDPAAAGDDHIRMIKDVLKETFPSADGVLMSVKKLTQSQYTALSSKDDQTLYVIIG